MGGTQLRKCTVCELEFGSRKYGRLRDTPHTKYKREHGAAAPENLTETQHLHVGWQEPQSHSSMLGHFSPGLSVLDLVHLFGGRWSHWRSERRLIRKAEVLCIE